MPATSTLPQQSRYTPPHHTYTWKLTRTSHTHGRSSNIAPSTFQIPSQRDVIQHVWMSSQYFWLGGRVTSSNIRKALQNTKKEKRAIGMCMESYILTTTRTNWMPCFSNLEAVVTYREMTQRFGKSANQQEPYPWGQELFLNLPQLRERGSTSSDRSAAYQENTPVQLLLPLIVCLQNVVYSISILVRERKSSTATITTEGGTTYSSSDASCTQQEQFFIAHHLLLAQLCEFVPVARLWGHSTIAPRK